MFSIKTKDLLSKLNVLSECCGNDSLNLLTSSLNLRTKNGKIQLITTDTVNFAYMYIDNAPNEEFDIFVNMALFTGLIKKCRSEEIEFYVTDVGEASYLEVKSGSGVYKIQIIEKTKEFSIPEHKVDMNETKSVSLDLGIIRQIVSYNKPFLSSDVSSPGYHYYIKDNDILSNNGCVVCQHKFNGDMPNLVLNQRLVNVLKTIEGNNIQWYYCEDYNYFENDSINIYSKCTGINYPVEKTVSITNIGNSVNSVVVGVEVIKSVLDKVSLFVSPLQNNAISFMCDGKLTVKSLNANAVEDIDSAVCNGKFEFLVDGNDLMSVLTAIKDDDIENGKVTIYYCDGDGFAHINIITKTTVYAMGVLSDE